MGIRTGRFTGLILAFILTMGRVAHAEVTVTARAEPLEASLEDEIHLTVTFAGSVQSSEPVLPSLPAFKTVSSGTTSSIQIINGEMTAKKIFTYILIPQEKGEYTIGPVSVFAQGVEYQSNTVTVTITATPQAGAPQIAIDPRLPVPAEKPRGTGDTEGAAPARLYWIETDLSNAEPYVFEQILFTFRVFTGGPVGSAKYTLPEFDDFWSEEVVEERKYERTVSNHQYWVTEKVTALIPLHSGEITVGRTTLDLEVPERKGGGRFPFDDPFFGLRSRMRTKHFRSGPHVLNIKPLPEPIPDDFARLVGHFSLAVSLVPEQVTVGESATLNITIAGRGNIKDAHLPDNLDLTYFKVYDDEPQTETVLKETGIEGRKIFKKALVPTKAGRLTIPRFTLSTFNPETGNYEILDSRALFVHVAPAAGETLNPVLPARTAAPAEAAWRSLDDLAPIMQNFSLVPARSYRAWTWWILLLAICPPLLFFGTLVFVVIERRKREHNDIHRSKNALKNALRRSKRARDAGELWAAVAGYFGDKACLNPRTLTALDIGEYLRSRSITGEVAGRVRTMVEFLEGSRYGGGGIEDTGKWRGEIIQCIRGVDKALD